MYGYVSPARFMTGFSPVSRRYLEKISPQTLKPVKQTMLKIQEYLSTNTLDDLERDYAIKVKRHSQYPNLVLLKYNQIETKMTPMTRELRGIILDESDNWKVVCFSYKRFPNLNGETWGDEIDWETARVQTKEDGSLCQLFYYDNDWRVATSGTPDASGEVMGTKTTFADLFWKTWNNLGYELPKETNKCFSWELCCPENKVVTRHKKPRIVLHGARDIISLKELNPVIEAHYNNWECVKSYPFTDTDTVIEMANKLDPINEGEGFVICDKNYHRVKVKSEAYRRVAHFRDTLSTRAILEIVRNNEGEEAFIGFEEHLPLYNKINAKFQFLAGEIFGFYDAIKHIENQKEFALIAVKKSYSGILFGIRHGKFDSVKSYLAEIKIQTLENWLDIKFVEIG